jgi:hypothetical protein
MLWSAEGGGAEPPRPSYCNAGAGVWDLTGVNSRGAAVHLARLSRELVKLLPPRPATP